MKKNELKNRMNDAFSELTPNIFDGIMESVRLQEPVLSETTSEVKPTARKIFIRYTMSACAALIIICMCLFGLFAEKQDSLYMVLDINPEIEIKMDKSYKVKNIKGLNQDGKAIVKGLMRKNKEPIQNLIVTLLEEAADKSYLRDNEGILITLYTSDSGLYNDVKSKLGKCIDSKLEEMQISGVTTSFNQVKQSSSKKGRKVLESELIGKYGFEEKQVKDMSVLELIQYCQENNLLEQNHTKHSSDNTENEKSKKKKAEDKQTTSPLEYESEHVSEHKTDKAEDEKEILTKDNITIASSADPEYTHMENENPGSRKHEENNPENQTDETNPTLTTGEEETTDNSDETQPLTTKEEETTHLSDETQQPTTITEEETTSNPDENEDNYNPIYYGDFSYKMLNDNTVEITGYRGTKDRIKVPAIIKNKAVTKIGAEAFSENLFLKNVILPEGVTSIGRCAFRNCIRMAGIRLPKSLICIEDYAFWGCISLDKVRYGGTLESWNKIQVGIGNDRLLNADIVTGKVKAAKIKLAVASKKIEVGDKIAVIVIIKPENAEIPVLEWHSSDSSIATVDDYGLVTAISPGMVKISAMAKDGSTKTASINIKIVDTKNKIKNKI